MKRFILNLLLAVPVLLSAQTATTRIEKNLTVFTDVMRQLDMNYFDTLNYDRMTEEAIRAMLRQVDPYTIYIPKEQNTDLKIMTTGRYGGIGALIMMRDSMIYIAEPYEGMPAQRNDVRAGDCLVKVDNFVCAGQPTKEVSNRLRGEAGTVVRLTLKREGVAKPFIVDVERDEIRLPAIPYSYVVETDKDGQTPRIGYVLFSEFTTGSAMALYSRLLEMDMQNDPRCSLVLDLRGNGGGLIDEAIKLVSLFVDKDTEVVTTKGVIASANRSYKTTTSPVFANMNVVVLVDRSTASAAEIVSGSLQDLHRATVIGERTFGKGLVQSIRPIAYGGNLKVTTAHYYLPSGRCIQAIDYAPQQRGEKLERDTAGGILPDIVLTDSQKVDICYALTRDRLFFDYATRFRNRHASIAPPWDGAQGSAFEVTDDMVDDFLTFLDEKKYVYQTETSLFMKRLRELADMEDLDPVSLQLIDSLQSTLQPSYHMAVMKHKDEVKRLLGADIVERYYFQKGRIAYMLRDDKALLRAVEYVHSQQP